MGLPGGFPDKAKIIVRHKFCGKAFLVQGELIKGGGSSVNGTGMNQGRNATECEL